MCPSDHDLIHIRRRLTNPTRNTRLDNGQRPLVTFRMPIRGKRGRSEGDDNRVWPLALEIYTDARSNSHSIFLRPRNWIREDTYTPLLLDSATVQFSILYRPLPPPIIFTLDRAGIFLAFCDGGFPFYGADVRLNLPSYVDRIPVSVRGAPVWKWCFTADRTCQAVARQYQLRMPSWERSWRCCFSRSNAHRLRK